MLRQALTTLQIRAPARGLRDITRQIADWLDSQRIESGLLTLFCPHTSASLLIQENASKAARSDLETFFKEAPRLNPKAKKITGTICGVRIEEIEHPLMRKIRYMDKLVDELAKGRPMEKILRK